MVLNCPFPISETVVVSSWAGVNAGSDFKDLVAVGPVCCLSLRGQF